jgi:hypothetical protein
MSLNYPWGNSTSDEQLRRGIEELFERIRLNLDDPAFTFDQFIKRARSNLITLAVIRKTC